MLVSFCTIIIFYCNILYKYTHTYIQNQKIQFPQILFHSILKIISVGVSNLNNNSCNQNLNEMVDFVCIHIQSVVMESR